MLAPNYSANDFAGAIHALMPRGLVWPRDPASVQAQVIAGLAPTWQRHTAANNQLLVDAFPATAVELLPEWESTLGLPDPCAGTQPTIQLRQQQVVSRFTATGGQSIAYYKSIAASLGYDITVDEFAPFRFGQSTFGMPMYGPDWAFTWQVNAPAFTIERFRFGADAFGEPFAYWITTFSSVSCGAISRPTPTFSSTTTEAPWTV